MAFLLTMQQCYAIIVTNINRNLQEKCLRRIYIEGSALKLPPGAAAPGSHCKIPPRGRGDFETGESEGIRYPLSRGVGTASPHRTIESSPPRQTLICRGHIFVDMHRIAPERRKFAFPLAFLAIIGYNICCMLMCICRRHKQQTETGGNSFGRTEAHLSHRTVL